jgi:multiple sugar transport system permease protein
MQHKQARFFETQRGKTILENLTAYAFLAPAAIIVFLFGIFPVVFSFFVSLYRWRRTPGDYRGLDSYIRAMGELGYVLFFAIAISAVVFGVYTLYRMWQRSTAETGHTWRDLTFLVPGAALTAATWYFAVWFFELFYAILEIPQNLLGQDITRELFIDAFVGAFGVADVTAELDNMRFSVLGAVVLSIVWVYLVRSVRGGEFTVLAWMAGISFLVGWWLGDLTVSEVNLAIEEAQAEGTDLPIWTYTIVVLSGTLLLGAAWGLWSYAVHRHDQSNTTLALRVLAAIVALVGAVLLIMELPPTIENADEDVIHGFRVAFFYSAFSVPLQLVFGLALAVMLFQNIKGKSFFRVMFFMPYITPMVATSVVFTLIFSHVPSSPANQFMTSLGVDQQTWLRESDGVFFLLFGDAIPGWAHGPGLALVVIILYNVWIYAGYSTVIFLAGLGNISSELYEAARIDGANAWQQFRHITLPLLSPTTFFLILIATIGTLQAFTQIFLMRQPGGFEAVDTINLQIYDQIRGGSTPNYAYGSAMAFVLFGVILVLTLALNRIAGRRVFYG